MGYRNDFGNDLAATGVHKEHAMKPEKTPKHSSWTRLLGAPLGSLGSLLSAWFLMSASEAASRPGNVLLWLGASLALVVHVIADFLFVKSPKGIPSHSAIAAACLGEGFILVAAGYSNDWVVKIGDLPVGWIAGFLVLFLSFLHLLSGQDGWRGSVRWFKLAWTGVLFLGILASAIEAWYLPPGKVAESSMRATLGIICVAAAVAIGFAWRGMARRSERS